MEYFVAGALNVYQYNRDKIRSETWTGRGMWDPYDKEYMKKMEEGWLARAKKPASRIEVNLKIESERTNHIIEEKSMEIALKLKEPKKTHN